MTKLETFIAFIAGSGSLCCLIAAMNTDFNSFVYKRKSKVPMWAWLVLACVLFAVCNTAKAQTDSRWRLVPGIDSLVTGPLSDVRYMAGLRSAKNQQMRDCAWELARRSSEIDAMSTARIAMQKELDKSNRTINEAMEQADRMNERANKAEAKVKRRKPIPLILAGTALGFILSNQLR